LLPIELANANNAGNGLKGLGDILGGLGKVAMIAGLGPANPFKQVSNMIPGTAGPFGLGDGITYAQGLQDGIEPPPSSTQVAKFVGLRSTLQRRRDQNEYMPRYFGDPSARKSSLSPCEHQVSVNGHETSCPMP